MSQPSVPCHDPDQLDSAWKCALDWLLEECLALCFPAIAMALDLSRPVTVLDTELHQPADGTFPAANACHADRVLRCFIRDGREVYEIMRTKGEPLARRLAKCRLAKALLGFKLDQPALQRMLELLDRLMHLPREQDAVYRRFISTIKEDKMQTLMQRLRHDILRRALERGASWGHRSGFRTGRIAGHEQGREEGREVGREEGREEGKRLLLINLIEQRFGPLPAQALAGLQQASAAELERLGKRFCDASSLEELLG